MQYVVVPITLINKGFLIRYACENWEEVENVNCNYCHSLETLSLHFYIYEKKNRLRNVNKSEKRTNRDENGTDETNPKWN